MAFKPNYNQQRAERNRLKAQKKQEKLDKRSADAARRKAERAGDPEVAGDGDPTTLESADTTD